MMHALRYERPGQRFAHRERPRSEWQHKHIHLHLHLHLSFPVRQRRSTQPGAFRVTRIFTALVGATVMAFLLFGAIFDSPATSPFFVLAFFSFLAGLVFAWVAAVAMLIEAWRSTPRVRLLLALPCIPFLILLFLTLLRMMRLGLSLGTLGGALNGTFLGPFFLPFLFCSYPLISTILFNRAIHQAALADRWQREVFRLSFAMVGGMVLLLLGAVIECLTLLLAAPAWFQLVFSWPVWLPLLSMCVAVIVAVYTLFSRPRSAGKGQAGPKDASPSGTDSAPYTRGYRG